MLLSCFSCSQMRCWEDGDSLKEIDLEEIPSLSKQPIFFLMKMPKYKLQEPFLFQLVVGVCCHII